jgi:multicomponent Na+:H+ antiporter subunit E
MTRLLLFAVLMINWIIFSGRFDWFHLGLGILSSILVTLLCGTLKFQDHSITLAGRFRILFLGAGYSLWLLIEIIKANFYVLILSLDPRMHERIEPHLMRFKTSLRSDFAKFVFANSITLTPGTVTLDIEDDEFIVHAISYKAAEGLPGEMEKRIKAVFEPRTNGREA